MKTVYNEKVLLSVWDFEKLSHQLTTKNKYGTKC